MDNRLIMKTNLEIADTNLPHIPFHLIDDKKNVVATIYHNEEDKMYAKLFKNAPKMHEIILKVLENYAKSPLNDTILDLEMLKEITDVQNDLYSS